MKIKYRNVKLGAANKLRLQQINSIIGEYQAQGLVLTLRQLYYQLVSRDVIPNKLAEYAKLSTLLKEGRMAGIVDWDAIEDRLRQPDKPASWESPKEILEQAARQFRVDRMNAQQTYIEVWVEKDALSGVLSRVTRKYGINILVNRGYSSASAMHDAYQRFKNAMEAGKEIRVIYIGDFDPSGLDMIRDIKGRICEFYQGDFFDGENENNWEVEDYADSMGFDILPIALTKEQITQYNPPENPAKRKDPRFTKFQDEHGNSSWEVDALRPEVLNEILEKAIEENIDLGLYEGQLETEEQHKKKLKKIITDYN